METKKYLPTANLRLPFQWYCSFCESFLKNSNCCGIMMRLKSQPALPPWKAVYLVKRTKKKGTVQAWANTGKQRKWLDHWGENTIDNLGKKEGQVSGYMCPGVDGIIKGRRKSGGRGKPGKGKGHWEEREYRKNMMNGMKKKKSMSYGEAESASETSDTVGSANLNRTVSYVTFSAGEMNGAFTRGCPKIAPPTSQLYCISTCVKFRENRASVSYFAALC